MAWLLPSNKPAHLLQAAARWLPGLAAGLCLGVPAQAQEFSRYLTCAGSFESEGRQEPAHLDLALRFNGQRALIQRSNLLPVGERLRYTASPIAYSMDYVLRPKGTQVLVVPGWFQNTVLVKYPNLKKINQIRLSIDRQTGALEGTTLSEEDESLATFRMSCQSRSAEELPAPRF